MAASCLGAVHAWKRGEDGCVKPGDVCLCGMVMVDELGGYIDLSHKGLCPRCKEPMDVHPWASCKREIAAR